MKRASFALLLTLIAAFGVYAQDPAPGFPPYGSFADGNFDAVNLQNLNVNFAIPVMSSPGRGLNTSLALVYDSLLWKKNGNAWSPVTDGGGSPIWGWKKVSPTGSIQYVKQTGHCIDPDTGNSYPATFWNSYSYTDPSGTKHTFQSIQLISVDMCNPNQIHSSGADDGSGYFLDATSPDAPVAWSSGGLKITLDGTVIDLNGNFLSKIVVNSSETDWKDTRNVVALKVITGGTTIQYQFLDTAGAYQTATLNLTTFNIKTNFGCSGITEYTGSNISLPTSFVLPNGKQYSFTYEDTPSFAGYKTGRLRRVTLPTGGYYEYQYPTGSNNGLVCPDATVNNLTRVVNDGSASSTWAYVRTLNGTTWTNTITAPQLGYDGAANQTVITFDGNGHETSRKFYQGSTAGTLLRTINTTWNGTPNTRITILENNQQSEIETTYDSYGNLLQLTEHDWGTGSPGSVVRNTINTISTNTAYTSRHIVNLLTQTKVTNLGGVVQFRKDITYDGGGAFTGSNCVTGAVQHDDTNYGCSFTTRGLPTSVTTYTDAATPSGAITKNFVYDSLGNLRQADVNCCQHKTWNYSTTTQYAFPDSSVRGSSSPQLTTSATYSAYTGQVLTSTNENGQVTTFTYSDPGHLNRLTDIQRPDTQHITYAYDDTARTVTVTSPIQSGASVKQIGYFDGLGRSIKQQVTDNGGTSYSIGESQYDVLGRPFRASNPHNSSAQYWNETDFDALGRPTAAKVLTSTYTVTSGNTSTYIYAGPAVTVTDPAGKQKKSVADGLGRVATVYEPDVANGNALTQSTTYTYNLLDELLTVAQGIQSRTYVYDGLGRVLSSTTPESGRTCFGTVSGSTCNADGYDSFDNLKYRTDARGVLTSYSYDTLNRLTQISYNVGSTGVPATPSVTYTYGISSSCNAAHGIGCIGRVITTTDGVGSENYSFDILGRVTQLQKAIGATTYPVSYAYNYASELTSMTYSSNRIVQPNYDAIGRLCSVGATGSTCTTGTNYASGFGYNPAGQVTGFNYGNGASATLGYTADRLLLQTLSYAKGATTLLSLSYGYTQNGANNGQITSITDNTGTQEAGRSVTYTYDALYRLSTAVTTGSTSYPKWGLSWAYDRYGNRLNQTQTFGSPPTNSLSFASPSGGALTNRQDNMCFDANGNLMAETAAPCPSPTYVYDAENRMVNYSSAAYTYDGNGLRVKKVSGGTTTVYIFSGSKVIAEYDNSAPVGSPSREYLYSGGALLAKVEGGATSYYHPDHLSTRVLTDSSGNSLGSRGHYPYGETWYESGTTTKLKFTTYERDSESANDFALARYHINRFGRFSSADRFAGSIRNPQSLNRFLYVGGDPINFVDPMGAYECRPHGSPDGECVVRGDDYFGGGGGNCTMDNGWTPCGTVFAFLSAGAAAQCPANNCEGVTIKQDGTIYRYQPTVISYSFWALIIGEPHDGVVDGQMGMAQDNYFGFALVAVGKVSDDGFMDTFWTLMDTYWRQVPWSATVTFTPVAVPVSYIPKSNTLCVGFGPAAGVSLPDVPVTVNGGPLVYGDLNNARDVLSGFSISYGLQPTPGIGWQHTFNNSGRLLGPTAGPWGGNIVVTYSGCWDLKK